MPSCLINRPYQRASAKPQAPGHDVRLMRRDTGRRREGRWLFRCPHGRAYADRNVRLIVFAPPQGQALARLMALARTRPKVVARALCNAIAAPPGVARFAEPVIANFRRRYSKKQDLQ
jgi:hypothetical protein